LLRIVKEEDDSCDIMWTNPHFTVWSGRWFTQWHCSVTTLYSESL